MTHFGVIEDYGYTVTHKRQRLTVWSGPFASVLEADAYTLPKRDGYMLYLYHGGRVRVTCPTPRNSETYQEVDAAIDAALKAHFGEDN